MQSLCLSFFLTEILRRHYGKNTYYGMLLLSQPMSLLMKPHTFGGQCIALSPFLLECDIMARDYERYAPNQMKKWSAPSSISVKLFISHYQNSPLTLYSWFISGLNQTNHIAQSKTQSGQMHINKQRRNRMRLTSQLSCS